MNTDRFRRLVSLALIASVLWPPAVRAATVTLKPGMRIGVDVARRGHLVGTIRTVEATGFRLQPDTGDVVFVAFASVTAYLDPDSGVVIALPPRSSGPPWAKAAVITAAVVIGLAVLTHGMFPGCLFARCD